MGITILSVRVDIFQSMSGVHLVMMHSYAYNKCLRVHFLLKFTSLSHINLIKVDKIHMKLPSHKNEQTTPFCEKGLQN